MWLVFQAKQISAEPDYFKYYVIECYFEMNLFHTQFIYYYIIYIHVLLFH